MTAKVTTSRRQKLALALLPIVMMGLLLELGIRARDAVSGYGFFSSHRNILKADFKPVLPFRTFGQGLYVEQDGERFVASRHGELYPLPKRPGSFRVVCFGGSTTENKKCFKQTGMHYPLRLQELLRERLDRDDIEVINLGYSGYATPHSLILLELNVLEWEPDLLILSHNYNDLLASYWPNFTPDYGNKYEHPYYSVPDYGKRYTALNVLGQYSQLYWVIWKRIEGFKRARAYEAQKRIHRESLGAAPLAAAAHCFERNLRSFATLAGARGIPVLFGSQARHADEAAFLEHIRGKPYNQLLTYPLHEELMAHHRAYNEILGVVSEEMGLIFADNDKALAGAPEFFFDFIHYTPEGVDRLAESYAKTILDAGFLR